MVRHFFLLAFFFAITVVRTFSQSVPDTVYVNRAIQTAKRLYTSTIGGDAHLYSGTEYKYPLSGFDLGHPYFLSDVLEEGSVTYDGQVYTSVEILYNLVTGAVVIEHAYSHVKIALVPQMIESFTLQNHFFRRLPNGPVQTEFYDVLYDGDLKLYAVRKKGAYPDVKNNKPIKMFVVEDQFFLYKGNQYFPLKNTASLFRILSEHKNEIRQHLTKNKIHTRKDTERALIESVKFYDNIQKGQ